MNDQIFVSGGPRAWRLQETANAFANALRRGKWVGAGDAVNLSVSCVGLSEMTRLNARYRGIRAPTDVLSFEQPRRGPKGVAFLGDVVLCKEIVRRQAKGQGHSVLGEAAVLLAHGILHLLGYDHEASLKGARRMAAAEKKLLRLAGYGGLSAGLIERAAIRMRHVNSKRR